MNVAYINRIGRKMQVVPGHDIPTRNAKVDQLPAAEANVGRLQTGEGDRRIRLLARDDLTR